jgi:adenine-specific DNA-methyltransferase
LLCDEIFGSQNFVANIIWEKKFSPQNDAKWLSDSHDHILLYAKDKENWQPNLLQRTSVADSRYKNPDNDPRGPWASSDFTVKTPSDAYIYPITTPSGRIVMPAKSRSWTTSEQNFLALKEDNRIWFGENGNNIPRIKSFLSEVKEGLVCKTIWYRTEVGDTQEGTRDLKAVFDGQLPFTNPKPIRLIERIIQIASNNESIILDFFAGCGTTGHSLLRFNSEHHESKRRFILCTNNENEICRKVTYERIKKTIKKENYSASLKYYKIDYIPISDRLYYEYADELLEHIRELVELENAINFLGNDKIAIVLTDEELDDFVKNIKKNKNCRKLYRAHNVLVSGVQKEKLKSAKIKVNVIPDYYYGDMEI